MYVNPHTAGSAVDAAPQVERIRLARIQTFFSNAKDNPISLVVGGMLSALALASVGVSRQHLLTWCALVLLSSAAIYAFERYVRHAGLDANNAGRLFRIRLRLGLVNAALFGGLSWVLLDEPSGMAYILVFIVMSSITALAYMVYATEFFYGVAVNALTLLPFTLFCLYRYLSTLDSFLLLLSVIAVVWQLIVVGKALRVARTAVGAIEVNERLRDEMAGRTRVEAELRGSREEARGLAAMLRLMCDNVPDMIWAKDLEGRYLFANKALCERLLGAVDTREPLGRTFDFFAERERAAHADNSEWFTYGKFSKDVDRHTLSRDEPTTFEESGTVRGDLVFLDVHQARFLNAQGEVIGTVGGARDVTERKASEAFVQHLAHHDVLTDLPNRALFNDRLQQALAQVKRDRARLAVLFIDLDRLKPVNDTYGHDIGDLLLMEVAARLRSVVTRKADTVSRLGGDEFVVLLQRINKEQDAQTVAEWVLSALNQPFLVDRHTLRISASIGIAVAPQHGIDAETLLRSADLAMYSVKHGGRNGFRFFDDAMRPATGDTPLPS